MLKPFARVLCVVLVLGASLDAELKFTVHTEIRQVPSAVQNEMSAFLGQMLSQAIPAGGFDQMVTAGERAVRIETKQAMPGVPPVLLVRDGQSYGLDPVTKTYWKQQASSAEQMQQVLGSIKPEIKINRTGQFETINNMRAERYTMTMSLALPGLGDAAPGMPGGMVMTFDLWLTDAIKNPSGWMPSGADPKLLAQFGLGDMTKIIGDRFMLKGVMGANLFGGTEFVFSTRDISTVDVPDSVFDIPKDYREVAPR